MPLQAPPFTNERATTNGRISRPDRGPYTPPVPTIQHPFDETISQLSGEIAKISVYDISRELCSSSFARAFPRTVANRVKKRDDIFYRRAVLSSRTPANDADSDDHETNFTYISGYNHESNISGTNPNVPDPEESRQVQTLQSQTIRAQHNIDNLVETQEVTASHDTLLALAFRAVGEDRRDTAINLATKALLLDPLSCRAALLRALLLIIPEVRVCLPWRAIRDDTRATPRARRLEAAIVAARQASMVDDGSRVGHLVLAQGYLAAGNFQEAAVVFTGILSWYATMARKQDEIHRTHRWRRERREQRRQVREEEKERAEILAAHLAQARARMRGGSRVDQKSSSAASGRLSSRVSSRGLTPTTSVGDWRSGAGEFHRRGGGLESSASSDSWLSSPSPSPPPRGRGPSSADATRRGSARVVADRPGSPASNSPYHDGSTVRHTSSREERSRHPPPLPKKRHSEDYESEDEDEDGVDTSPLPPPFRRYVVHDARAGLQAIYAYYHGLSIFKGGLRHQFSVAAPLQGFPGNEPPGKRSHHKSTRSGKSTSANSTSTNNHATSSFRPPRMIRMMSTPITSGHPKRKIKEIMAAQKVPRTQDYGAGSYCRCLGCRFAIGARDHRRSHNDHWRTPTCLGVPSTTQTAAVDAMLRLDTERLLAHLSVVKEIDPWAPDMSGLTLLHLAASLRPAMRDKAGRAAALAALGMLLDSDVHVDMRAPLHHVTPLQVAVLCANPRQTELLLAAGADPHAAGWVLEPTATASVEALVEMVVKRNPDLHPHTVEAHVWAEWDEARQLVLDAARQGDRGRERGAGILALPPPGVVTASMKTTRATISTEAITHRNMNMDASTRRKEYAQIAAARTINTHINKTSARTGTPAVVTTPEEFIRRSGWLGKFRHAVSHCRYCHVAGTLDTSSKTTQSTTTTRPYVTSTTSLPSFCNESDHDRDRPTSATITRSHATSPEPHIHSKAITHPTSSRPTVLWRCARCEMAAYCCKTHQQRDYEDHRRDCDLARKLKRTLDRLSSCPRSPTTYAATRSVVLVDAEMALSLGAVDRLMRAILSNFTLSFADYETLAPLGQLTTHESNVKNSATTTSPVRGTNQFKFFASSFVKSAAGKAALKAGDARAAIRARALFKLGESVMGGLSILAALCCLTAGAPPTALQTRDVTLDPTYALARLTGHRARKKNKSSVDPHDHVDDHITRGVGADFTFPMEAYPDTVHLATQRLCAPETLDALFHMATERSPLGPYPRRAILTLLAGLALGEGVYIMGPDGLGDSYEMILSPPEPRQMTARYLLGQHASCALPLDLYDNHDDNEDDLDADIGTECKEAPFTDLGSVLDEPKEGGSTRGRSRVVDQFGSDQDNRPQSLGMRRSRSTSSMKQMRERNAFGSSYECTNSPWSSAAENNRSQASHLSPRGSPRGSALWTPPDQNPARAGTSPRPGSNVVEIERRSSIASTAGRSSVASIPRRNRRLSSTHSQGEGALQARTLVAKRLSNMDHIDRRPSNREYEIQNIYLGTPGEKWGDGGGRSEGRNDPNPDPRTPMSHDPDLTSRSMSSPASSPTRTRVSFSPSIHLIPKGNNHLPAPQVERESPMSGGSSPSASPSHPRTSTHPSTSMGEVTGPTTDIPASTAAFSEPPLVQLAHRAVDTLSAYLLDETDYYRSQEETARAHATGVATPAATDALARLLSNMPGLATLRQEGKKGLRRLGFSSDEDHKPLMDLKEVEAAGDTLRVLAVTISTGGIGNTTASGPGIASTLPQATTHPGLSGRPGSPHYALGAYVWDAIGFDHIVTGLFLAMAHHALLEHHAVLRAKALHSGAGVLSEVGMATFAAVQAADEARKSERDAAELGPHHTEAALTAGNMALDHEADFPMDPLRVREGPAIRESFLHLSRHVDPFLELVYALLSCGRAVRGPRDDDPGLMALRRFAAGLLWDARQETVGVGRYLRAPRLAIVELLTRDISFWDHVERDHERRQLGHDDGDNGDEGRIHRAARVDFLGSGIAFQHLFSNRLAGADLGVNVVEMIKAAFWALLSDPAYLGGWSRAHRHHENAVRVIVRTLTYVPPGLLPRIAAAVYPIAQRLRPESPVPLKDRTRYPLEPLVLARVARAWNTINAHRNGKAPWWPVLMRDSQYVLRCFEAPSWDSVRVGWDASSLAGTIDVQINEELDRRVLEVLVDRQEELEIDQKQRIAMIEEGKEMLVKAARVSERKNVVGSVMAADVLRLVGKGDGDRDSGYDDDGNGDDDDEVGGGAAIKFKNQGKGKKKKKGGNSPNGGAGSGGEDQPEGKKAGEGTEDGGREKKQGRLRRTPSRRLARARRANSTQSLLRRVLGETFIPMSEHEREEFELLEQVLGKRIDSPEPTESRHVG